MPDLTPPRLQGCASLTRWPAPSRETPEDRQREQDRERLGKAFPQIEP
jgi:hypothetical protein